MVLKRAGEYFAGRQSASPKRGTAKYDLAILLDPMFELPGLAGVSEIVINREVVEGRAKPLYVHSDRRGEGTGA